MINGPSTITVAGADLYCDSAGERGSAVLLVHAGNTDSSMWDGQFEWLSQRYRVLRSDLRGFGRSSLPPGQFSCADDLAELITRWGAGPVVVVGASAGARIGLELTLLHPDLVRGLVLAAPITRRHQWSDYLLRARAEEQAALDAGVVPAAIESVMRTWLAGPHRRLEDVDPVLLNRLRATQRTAYQVQRAADAGGQAPGPDLEPQPLAEERWSEITVPTKILVGDLDVPDALEIANILAKSIAGACLDVIPNAAHMVTMERGPEFLELTERFVDSLALR